MAKRKAAEADSSTATLPPEGTGETAEQFDTAATEAGKHDAIADVMADAGVEVESSAPVEAVESTPEPKPQQKPELGPNVSEGKVEEDAPAPKAKASRQAETPPEPELNKHQVSTAKQLGYTEEEIADMDPEIWGDMLDRGGRKLHTKFSELGRLEKRLKTDGVPDAEEAPDKDDQAAAQKPEDQEDTDLGFEYEQEDWRDEQDLPKRNKHLAATRANNIALQELKSQVSELLEERRGAEADGFFTDLDAESFPMFGEGKQSELGSDSPQAKARGSLIEEAINLRKYWKSQGQPISLAEALDRALYHLHPKAVKNAEHKKIASDVRRRRGRAHARPTHRRTVPLPSTDESSKHQEIANVAKAAGIKLDVSK